MAGEGGESGANGMTSTHGGHDGRSPTLPTTRLDNRSGGMAHPAARMILETDIGVTRYHQSQWTDAALQLGFVDVRIGPVNRTGRALSVRRGCG